MIQLIHNVEKITLRQPDHFPVTETRDNEFYTRVIEIKCSDGTVVALNLFAEDAASLKVSGEM